MATAPVADQRRLLDVQALDTRAQQLAHRRRTLPVLERIAGLDSELADLDKAIVASRTQASDLRRELSKAETDVEQVLTRVTRDQQRLESGQTGAKDAQALITELESLSRRQGTLEEIQLDVMERLEAHESALGRLDEARSVTAAAHDKASAERDGEQASIDADLAQVAAERATIAAGIDTGLVTLYDKLRSQLGGLAAARLEGRHCGGCRMELNPTDLNAIKSAAVDAIVRCEECGRILVREPA